MTSDPFTGLGHVFSLLCVCVCAGKCVPTIEGGDPAGSTGGILECLYVDD